MTSPNFHSSQLNLEVCPHCNISRPTLSKAWDLKATKDHAGIVEQVWGGYACASCGGVTIAVSQHSKSNIYGIWPTPHTVSEAVPTRAREYLKQAIGSQHAPAGAIMLCASAVDAMLKDKNYKDGTLNARIDAAARDHLITAEMAAWVHEIRLDANDQRHADETAGLPNSADAEKAIEFAKALAQFLYILPARVERGRKKE